MRISQREKTLLGYSHTNSSRSQTSLQNPDASSPQNSNRSSRIDFSDVFGGPPRRSGSFQDLQRRLHDDSDDDSNNDVSNGDDGDGFTGRRSGAVGNQVGSMPVFGTEVYSRRRNPSEDFYGDIFGGDQPSTLSRSPRTSGGKNSFSSAPGSRVLSPTRPLTLGVEPPVQLSLPARLVSTVHPSNTSYRPSPLSSSKSSNNLEGVSHKAALGSDGIIANSGVHGLSSDEESKRTSSDTSDHNHFHFSIYKWASKGVPLSMSLRSGGTRFKEENVLSSINSLESDTLRSDIQPKNLKVDDDTFMPTKESELKQDADLSRTPISRFNDNVVDGNQDMGVSRAPSSRVNDNVGEGLARKQTSSRNAEVKVKPSFTVDPEASYIEAETVYKLKESIRHLREQMESTGDRRQVKKDNTGRNIKGKVKEFAKIFNQESSVKPKNYGGGQSRTSSRINVDSSGAGNQGATGSWAKKQAFNVNSGSDSSYMEEGNLVFSGGILAGGMNETHLKSVHKDNLASTDVPYHTKDSSTSNNVIDEASISIEEIQEMEEILAESIEDHHILDSKVLKWSKGKEGNIRALLSTLQYVLWPNSGWKPVPLVDIIEGSSVKRSYQRALLCLHPDKLQQKGAASDEKYTAARVFDVLQEAGDQFNSLGSL